MLVRVEAGHTVLPERLAMMLVRVEAGHMVLPERLAMMLVAVEVGHVVGHILSRQWLESRYRHSKISLKEPVAHMFV